MDRSSVENKVQEIAAAAATDQGLELVRVTVKGAEKNPTVVVFIDKQGGVTHEDCAKVSRQMGEALDADDFIPSAYILEVSSPGLERELYSLQDFVRFTGSLAKVKTNTPIDGQRSFRGKIAGVEGETIAFDDRTRGTVSFPYGHVAKANLEIDLEAELSRAKEEKISNK
jgi:ribosome maturation factor RimP